MPRITARHRAWQRDVHLVNCAAAPLPSVRLTRTPQRIVERALNETTRKWSSFATKATPTPGRTPSGQKMRAKPSMRRAWAGFTLVARDRSPRGLTKSPPPHTRRLLAQGPAAGPVSALESRAGVRDRSDASPPGRVGRAAGPDELPWRNWTGWVTRAQRREARFAGGGI